MGSIGESPVVGQYMHPVIDQNTRNDDRWQRNYFQPPQLKNLVPRSYPLTDIRPLLSRPEYSPSELLQSHGFGVVKHHSAFLAQDGEVAEQAITEVYHLEIEGLVLKTTGAKRVFFLASVLRQGKRGPEPCKLPIGLKSSWLATASQDQSKQEGNAPAQEAPKHKLAGQSNLALAAPVRIPHMDFTPLGARQIIRAQPQAIHDAAVHSGVIAFEDKICTNQPFTAATKEASAAIAESYNQHDELGPATQRTVFGVPSGKSDAIP